MPSVLLRVLVAALIAFPLALNPRGVRAQSAPPDVVAMAGTPTGGGYWAVSAKGEVFAFGDAAPHGSLEGVPLNSPITGIAATSTGGGYWLAAADGGVFAFGDARFFGSGGISPCGGVNPSRGTGSCGPQPPEVSAVAIARGPDGGGYWLPTDDGFVAAFGNARAYGFSIRGTTMNRPVVDMAATPSGQGYWLVASDGGVFAFGDARFLGSMGNARLNRPVVGMAATPSGQGYWLVASDGGVFAFGDARFLGSMGNARLNRPVVGMAATRSGQGYWLVASDGGVFAFGDARFLGRPQ